MFSKKDTKGTRNVTAADLVSYELPTREERYPKGQPTKAGNWSPIHHGDLVSTINRQLRNEGWDITSQDIALTANDHTIALWTEIAAPQVWEAQAEKMDLLRTYDGFKREGINLGLLTRHSNMGKMSLRMSAQCRVLVCDNGLAINIADSFQYGQRNKQGLPLDFLVETGLKLFGLEMNALLSNVKHLKGIPCPTQLGDWIILESLMRGVVKQGMVESITNEWRAPRHVAHEARTAYNLLQAFTQIAQTQAINSQIDLLPKANSHITDFFQSIENGDHLERIVLTSEDFQGETIDSTCHVTTSAPNDTPEPQVQGVALWIPNTNEES